jgi:hypothetical protein
MFDAAWVHTEGYPGMADPSVKDWFMAHAEEAVIFISAFPEATLQEMRKALDLQKAFQQVLDCISECGYHV